MEDFQLPVGLLQGYNFTEQGAKFVFFATNVLIITNILIREN